MKVSLQTIFYFLAIVALLLVIVYLVDTLMGDDDEEGEPQNIVLVPWVNYYRPHWRRFRRNLPWYGPRPGGRPMRRHRRFVW